MIVCSQQKWNISKIIVNGHMEACSCSLEAVNYRERSSPMVQEISGKLWQAEAGTAETKKFIRDIKRITRCKELSSKLVFFHHRLFPPW
jgi:hypothetical protein